MVSSNGIRKTENFNSMTLIEFQITNRTHSSPTPTNSFGKLSCPDASKTKKFSKFDLGGKERKMQSKKDSQEFGTNDIYDK